MLPLALSCGCLVQDDVASSSASGSRQGSGSDSDSGSSTSGSGSASASGSAGAVSEAEEAEGIATAAAGGTAAGVEGADSPRKHKHKRRSGSGSSGGTSSKRSHKRGGAATAAGARAAAAAAQGRGAAGPMMGTRIGVFWADDKTYYRGKVIAGDKATPGRFQVRYDDGEAEWLNLNEEGFIWHAPRAAAAGYNTILHSTMHGLDAQNIQAEAVPLEKEKPNSPTPPGPVAEEGEVPESPTEMVGRRLWLYWPGDGQWHAGEVLAFRVRKGLHHVLYMDGEEEWVDLAKEEVVWAKPLRMPPVAIGIVQGEC